MIIDTSAFSHLERKHQAVKASVVHAKDLFFPVMVLAELRSGYAHGDQEQKNIEKLNLMLAQPFCHVLDVNSSTVGGYVQIATYARDNGIALSHNDIWISALALQHSLPLATTDRDFLRIKSLLGKLLVFVEV